MISDAHFPTTPFHLPLGVNDIKALNDFIRTARTGDPALIVQFNVDGIADREQRIEDLVGAQLMITEFFVAHGLRREGNSEIIFYHASQAFVFEVLHQLLQQFPWCRHEPGHPDIGFAYVMLTERRRPDTTWLRFVFNQV